MRAGESTLVLSDFRGKLSAMETITHQPATGERILRRMRGKGRGTVWTPQHFMELGTPAAVHQALSRLVASGEVQRLAPGIYAFPRVSKRFGVPVPPAPEEIAHAVAGARGYEVEVTPARAANLLGLTTQVPSRNVFLTDGPSRTIVAGAQRIELRHASKHRLAGAGRKEGLVLRAMEYLGREEIGERTIRKLGGMLTAQERKRLVASAARAPTWMRAAAHRIAEQADS
jgi:hypothetical protein